MNLDIMWIALSCALLSSLIGLPFWARLINCVTILLFALWAITSGLGYPTNQSFPSHAIIYGLTADHVWAGTKEQPYPPRSYLFQPPPEWFEERDRRNGQPFEVEQENSNGNETDAAGDSNSNTPKWMIIPSVELPPKDV